MAEIVGKTYPITKTTARRAPRKPTSKKGVAAAASSKKSEAGKDAEEE